MSCMKYQLLCCFGGRSCRMCCRCFPVAYESTTTRLMYTFYLMIATAFMCISLSLPLIRESLDESSYLNRGCDFLKLGSQCEQLSGFVAVYRISLAVSGFFALMSVFTFGVNTSQHWRANFHNGYWLIKFLLISAMTAGTFYIPGESVDHFKMYWMYVALAGAVLFVIIQLWLLIVFARGLSRSIRLKVRRGGSPCIWYGLSIAFGVIGFAICFVSIFFLAVNFTEWKSCTTNKLFIGVSSLLIVICSAVAMLPCSRRPDLNLKSSLLQSSIMSLYILYLTWSALSSEPREPIPELLVANAAEALGSRNSTQGKARSFPFEIEGVTNEQKFYCGPEDNPDSWINKYVDPYLPYIGVIVMFFTVIYSSLGTSASQARDLGVTGLTLARRRHKQNFGCWKKRKSTEQDCSVVVEDEGGQLIIRNEREGVIYSYSLFHAIFAMATMYIMVQLTGWFRPDESTLISFSRNWDSVWIKMCTSWACALMYLISLMLPARCFQGKDGVRISATDDDLQLPDR